MGRTSGAAPGFSGRTAVEATGGGLVRVRYSDGGGGDMALSYTPQGARAMAAALDAAADQAEATAREARRHVHHP